MQKIMHCQEIKGILSLYADNALDECTHKLVKIHLEECESCRHSNNSLELLLETVAKIQEIEPPQNLKQNIINAVESINTNCSCNDIAELLSSYVDGELPLHEQEMVREHVLCCDECRQQLQNLKLLVSVSQEIEEVEPPLDLKKKIIAATANKGAADASKWLCKLFSVPALRWGGIAAATLLITISLTVKTAVNTDSDVGLGNKNRIISNNYRNTAKTRLTKPAEIAEKDNKTTEAASYITCIDSPARQEQNIRVKHKTYHPYRTNKHASDKDAKPVTQAAALNNVNSVNTIAQDDAFEDATYTEPEIDKNNIDVEKPKQENVEEPKLSAPVIKVASTPPIAASNSEEFAKEMKAELNRKRVSGKSGQMKIFEADF